jgi:two-component system LytT family sensor kinase
MADRLLDPDQGDDFDDDSEFDDPYARGFSTNPAGPSTNDSFGKGFFLNGELTDGMDMQSRNFITRRLPDVDIAIKTIAAFWVLYMVLITLRGVVVRLPGFWDLLERRSMAALVGAALTFLVYLAMRPMAAMSLPRKAVLAGLICLPASAAYATFNYAIFYIFSPLEAAKWDPAKEKMSEAQMAFQMIAEGTLSWYFLFAAWASLYMATSVAAQLRASDRRAAAFAREAQEAQLRALRYQINPHFLFNTLNSLSSLILSQRTDIAERMIMNLSTFFRTTLSADPTADISLEEEIKLQRLYLDIEQIRFPERLRVEVDVPEHLQGVRVPVLILQPIVENAIKYGVARSRDAVTVRICAYEEAGRLHLKVKDNGDAKPADGADCGGTGVGLKNVCERLIARYGVEAGCFHGPDPEGGFTVHVILPIVRHQ